MEPYADLLDAERPEGLFQLGETITRALEGVLVLAALTGLFYFLRAALAHEPIGG